MSDVTTDWSGIFQVPDPRRNYVLQSPTPGALTDDVGFNPQRPGLLDRRPYGSFQEPSASGASGTGDVSQPAAADASDSWKNAGPLLAQAGPPQAPGRQLPPMADIAPAPYSPISDTMRAAAAAPAPVPEAVPTGRAPGPMPAARALPPDPYRTEVSLSGPYASAAPAAAQDTPEMQAVKQRIASAMAVQRPARPTENWASRLGLAILSMTRLAPMAQQIIHPRYTQQMAPYQAAQQELAELVPMEKELAQAQAEQERGQYYGGLEAGRQEERRITAQGRIEGTQARVAEDALKRQQMAYDTLTKGRTPLYKMEGEAAPPGWERMPLANPALPAGWVTYLPSAITTVPKELLPYLPGYKEGDTIDRDALERATKTYQTEIEKRAVQPAKLPSNPAEVLLNPTAYTPAQVKTAQDLFAKEHRDPNAPPAGLSAARNPALPPDQRDENILKGMEPGTAAIIQQMADYKYPMPSGMAMRTPFWQNVLALTAQYDPSFDASQYQNRQKLRNDFMSGKSAQGINALNTVTQHVDRLEQNWKALNNARSPVLNAPINWFESAVAGDPRLNRFNLDQEAVANELMRTWRQVGANEAEVQSWAQKLSPNASPTTQQAAIKEIYELIKGKLGALKNQYETGMGKPADFHIMMPDTAKRFAAHGVAAEDLAPNATYPNARGAAQAGDYVRTGTGANGHRIGQKADGGWYDIQSGQRIQ